MKLKEVRLNQHQTHMEDLVLLGEEGINEFNDKINRFKRSLEGEDSGLNTTTKIDGAPAVAVWHTFEGLPNNSICLKSFMTPNPKVLSSIEDIENAYGDRPTMSTMLVHCLELSKYIPDGQAWQGDCLFINRTLKEREINGTSYLTFQPNKIIYAFSENNPGYEEVKNAEFGIAFHTIYTGNKEHKSQSFSVDAKELNAPSKFYILSPALNASSNKENYNLAELDNLQSKFTAQSEALLSDNSYNELINNKEFMSYWNTFENANLADKQATNINVNTFINDLKEYIDNKLEKEYNKKLGTLKTDKGRERALLNRNDSISRLNSIVENNKQTLVNLVNCLNTASDIKMLLWEGFKKTKTDYSTFYQSKTRGYLNADPEGIAMSDSDGNIVKIVDRSTFSSHNRDDDYTSGFDHQNEELECFNIYNEELQEVEPSWSKFESLLEGIKKLAVVGFGRMNPPTIGHEKLINKIHEVASKNGGKPLFYLSHTQDKKKNPLSYEDKLSWCRKAFGGKVELPNSNAKTMIDVLRELDSDGYTDIVYVGGGDRIGGAEDVTQTLLRYNGQPTKTGEIIYDFNSIDFVNAGDRSDDSDDITSRASASLAREYVKNNDFDNFSKIVPFNEKDAKELFNKLLTVLVESKLLENILNNGVTLSKLGNLFKPFINNEIGGLEKTFDYIPLNTSRHDKEILRIKPLTITYDELLNKVKKAIENNFSKIKSTKFELNNDYTLQPIDYDLEDISIHQGASKEYPSIKIIFQHKNDTGVVPFDVEEPFYITLVTDKGAVKKVFTPNKVLQDGLGKEIRYTDLKFKSGYEDFAKIYQQAIQNASSNESGIPSRYISNFINDGFITEENANSIMNDFGEVLSAGCLASILKGPGTIWFPKDSNANLIDFKINGSIEVSQKAGSGATPSGTGALEIINSKDEKTLKNYLFNKGYSIKDSNIVLDFIKWLNSNIYNSNIDTHTGFENLSKLINNQNSWLKLNLNIPNSFCKKYSVNKNNIKEFLDILNIKTNPAISKLNNNEIEKEAYESYRIRYLARLVINYINNNKLLINGFNDLLSACIGEFIQVYLVNKDEFISGNLIFNVKKLGSFTSKYKFSDASMINDNTGKLYNKKLAIKLS